MRVKEQLARTPGSVASIGARAGVSANHLMRVASGEKRLTYTFAHRIAPALDCSPGYLLDETDEQGTAELQHGAVPIRALVFKCGACRVIIEEGAAICRNCKRPVVWVAER